MASGIRQIQFYISVKGNDGILITEHFTPRDPEDPGELKWSEICALVEDFRKSIVRYFGIKNTQLHVWNNNSVGGSTQARLTSDYAIGKGELSKSFEKLRDLLIESIKEVNGSEKRKHFFIRTVYFVCSDISDVEIDSEDIPECNLKKDFIQN